jgi:hypothetical protein
MLNYNEWYELYGKPMAAALLLFLKNKPVFLSNKELMGEEKENIEFVNKFLVNKHQEYLEKVVDSDIKLCWSNELQSFVDEVPETFENGKFYIYDNQCYVGSQKLETIDYIDLVNRPVRTEGLNINRNPSLDNQVGMYGSINKTPIPPNGRVRTHQ